MIESGLAGVEFIAMNTDLAALERTKAPERLLLGGELMKGLGAGANPDTGHEAALESRDDIACLLDGADLVILIAGLGGGTGTGASPVVAQVSREFCRLTLGVVSQPFGFEGNRRRKQANAGIKRLLSVVDTLITIPNQRLISMAHDRMTMREAFRMADQMQYEATRAIVDLIKRSDIVASDFADLRTLMLDKGRAVMGLGIGRGENKTVEAARSAISCPLLDDVLLAGATSVLLNITGNSELTMFEIHEASTMVQEELHHDANVIWGWIIDESMQEETRVTIIAAGFGEGWVWDPSPPDDGQSVAMALARLSATLDKGDYDNPRSFRDKRRARLA